MERKEDVIKDDFTTSCELYFKNKTYVNLVERTSNGVRYWNGFIICIDDLDSKYIQFFDVVDKIDFPVDLHNIMSLCVSTKKHPDLQMALAIRKECERRW